jgi:cellulose synthase/poly-beta-1,6-N-acetylglucosamine synthase-like glycosyltransferase
VTGSVQQLFLPIGAAAAAVTLPGAIELMLVTGGAIFGSSLGLSKGLGGGRLAAVVPAHNEEALIGRCVASLLASAAGETPCSVVVVADNCTDATAARAREAGASVLVRHDALHRGKGCALRFAFDRLIDGGYEGFLIVDADSVVSANLVPEVAAALAGGAKAVQARYRVIPPLDSSCRRLMDVAFLAFNVLRPKGRDAWGLSAGILGNGFALSRQTLLDVPYSADSIVEDLEYHLLLVNAGGKVRFANAATVYGDMPDDAGASVSQRGRWEGGRARVARTWVPKLAAQVARGRLCAAEPLLELLTLPLAYMVLILLALCILPTGPFRWYGAAVMGLLVVHVASAMALGGGVCESVAALKAAPAYVFWKLKSLGAIVRSSGAEAQWLRTPRESDAIEKVPRV